MRHLRSHANHVKLRAMIRLSREQIRKLHVDELKELLELALEMALDVETFCKSVDRSQDIVDKACLIAEERVSMFRGRLGHEHE